MKILIVKLSAIGDVIHTLPALNALRAAWPDARIEWVTEKAAASLIIGHQAVDRVFVSERKRWIRGLTVPGERRQSLKAIGRFISELRKEPYDLVLDFHQLLKSGVLVWLSRGKVKAGFDRGMEHMEESHLFLNRRIPPVSMEIHALKRYLILVEALGVPVNDVTYRLPVKNADRKEAERLLAANGIAGGKPLIPVNPMAQWPTKLWKTDRFARLADRLISEYHADVVFTGGPDDKPVIREILKKMENPAPDLTGRTSLTALAALYQKARLVISTDTGPMHLSAAVNTPTAAIFGPTAPWRTGPYGSGHEVIRTGVECSPCFKRKCRRGDHICMEAIQVEDVLKAVERLGVYKETAQ